MLLYIIADLALFTFTTLFIARRDPAWKRLYNPWIILSGIYFLYTLSPLSNSYFLQAYADELPVYMLMQTLGLAGLAAGALAECLFRRPSPIQAPSHQFTKNALIKPLLVACVVALLFALDRFDGGLANVFLKGYYTGVELSGEDIVLLSIPLFSMVSLLCADYFLNGPSLFSGVLSVVYAGLMLSRGHRNMFVMEVGGLLAMDSLRRGRMTYPKIIVLGSIGYVFMMLIGMYRGFGWSGLADFQYVLRQSGWSVLSPSSQELSTTFDAFHIFYSHRGWIWESWRPGESYFRALLSVIPRALWPDRPESIATVFSSHFGLPGEGLGFSTNLEAYINFGMPGIFGINMLICFIISRCFRNAVLTRLTLAGVAMYASLVFIAFNLNRIDMQSVIKMSGLNGLLIYGSLRLRPHTRLRKHTNSVFEATW